MPFYHFFWIEENEGHVAEHGVSRDEFEEIVSNPDAVEQSRSSERQVARGMTSTGRYLCCVYELLDGGITVFPVTAYDIGD